MEEGGGPSWNRTKPQHLPPLSQGSFLTHVRPRTRTQHELRRPSVLCIDHTLVMSLVITRGRLWGLAYNCSVCKACEGLRDVNVLVPPYTGVRPLMHSYLSHNPILTATILQAHNSHTSMADTITHQHTHRQS